MQVLFFADLELFFSCSARLTMALIVCPDCGKEHSDQAVACPQCGRPNSKPRAALKTDLPAKSSGSGLSPGWASVFVIIAVVFAMGSILVAIQESKVAGCNSGKKQDCQDLLGDESFGRSDAITNKEFKLKFQKKAAIAKNSEIPADTLWIPAGYKPYNDNVAYKWRESQAIECGYRDSCYQMELVSKNGCSNLYVELTRLNSAGDNVGITNDTTGNLLPRQKAILTFSSFDEDKSAQLSEIICR